MNKIYNDLSTSIISSANFKTKYESLLRLQYPSNRNKVNLTLDDIKFMLKTASILSLSTDECKQMACKIAVILSQNYSDEYNQINLPIQIIIVNSGQMPVIRKNIKDGAKDYLGLYNNDGLVNPLEFYSPLIKTEFNRLPLDSTSPIFLTDFQNDLFYDLSEGKSVSISAPTSSGKSFLVKIFLAKKFKESKNLNVVCIVPTRALISQTQRDFNQIFKDFSVEDVSISSSPQYETSSNKKKLFVYTQERLHSLLFDTDFSEPLDVLIIDEAHKVSDASRGILLEEVISVAIKRNERLGKSLQTVFLMPFCKNPQKFAEIFKLDKLNIEKTKLSPVSQNLIKLDIYDKKYQFDLLLDGELNRIIEIENGIVPSDEIDLFTKEKDYAPLLWAAHKFASDVNIVYCNSKRSCINLALAFSLTCKIIDDAEISEVIKFLEDSIHPSYFLIDCLKHGVGYHHGGLPSQIRAIIENLFRKRKLKYIFCTSTLLEGVNLPAQNIFIFKPKQGKIGMGRLNFWNLAGRAGRLLEDYYGNIYCINISTWPGYKPNPNEVEQDIESILESVFINKHKEVLEYLKGEYKKLKENDKPIEQAITKFIIHAMKSGDTAFIDDLMRRNPSFEKDKLDIIQNEIQKIASKITISPEIIEKNSSINPNYQQELLEVFKSKTPPIPTFPTHIDFYKNLSNIYKIINLYFKRTKDQSHKYYTFLTDKWIKGTSFKELIALKIRNPSEQTALMINQAIDELFDDINDKLLFEYETLLKCYIDILLFFYKDSGYDTSRICEGLPAFIEYGTYQKNVIIFQSIGISRATALTLNKLAVKDFADEQDARTWLTSNKSLFSERLSKVINDEINSII